MTFIEIAKRTSSNSVTLANTPALALLRRIKILDSAVLFDFDKSNLKPGADKALSILKSTYIDNHPGGIFSVEVIATTRIRTRTTWSFQGSGPNPSRIG